MLFDADAQVRTGAAVLPGATVSIDPNVTAITEIGYRWRRIGISLTGGIPPLATVKGAGTLAPYGTLGKIRYGPVVLTAHYHFAGLGRLRPYVGGGAVFLLIFDNRDAAVTQLRVQNHWGAALQAARNTGSRRDWRSMSTARPPRSRPARRPSSAARRSRRTYGSIPRW